MIEQMYVFILALLFCFAILGLNKIFYLNFKDSKGEVIVSEK